MAEPAPATEGDPTGKTVDRLRQERLVFDGVTGLPLHPFEDPVRVTAIERIERARRHLPADRKVLRLRGAVRVGALRPGPRWRSPGACAGRRGLAPRGRISCRCATRAPTGSTCSSTFRGRRAAARCRPSRSWRSIPAIARSSGLRQTFGGTTVDLMSVHVSSLASPRQPARPALAPSDPHPRRSGQDRLAAADAREARLCVGAEGRHRAQELQGRVPAGSPPVGRRGPRLRGADPGAAGQRRSSRPTSSSPWRTRTRSTSSSRRSASTRSSAASREPSTGTALRQRVLAPASAPDLSRRAPPDGRSTAATPTSWSKSPRRRWSATTPTFRRSSNVRRSKLKIAIDDAGSGYSGLETILNLRPDYIKVADSLVRDLETDPIKREIIVEPRVHRQPDRRESHRRGHRARGGAARSGRPGHPATARASCSAGPRSMAPAARSGSKPRTE